MSLLDWTPATIPAESSAVVVMPGRCPACGGESTFVGHYSVARGTTYDIHCPACDQAPISKALCRIPRFL